MKSYVRLAFIVLCILMKILGTLQNQVEGNFNRSTLRLAKAAEMKAFMNEHVSACDDFYQHACGRWARLHPTDVNRPKTTYLDLLDELYVKSCVDLLHNIQIPDSSLQSSLKHFFQSCKDTATIRKGGVEPILKQVRFQGGWPEIRTPGWYETEYDWLKWVAILRRKLGVNILIGLEIVPDHEEQNMHRIKIGAPHFALGAKNKYLHIMHWKLREDYKDTIEVKLRKYFPQMSKQWAEEVADQVLEVEQKLAAGLPDTEKLTQQEITHEKSVAELRASYGNYVDLDRYFGLVFNDSTFTKVYVSPPSYLPNLVKVIKQVPKLTLANYTMWRVLSEFQDLDVLDPNYKLDLKKRETCCAHKIIEFYPRQVENFYYEKNKKHKSAFYEIFKEIKHIFREDLQNGTKLYWISKDTRELAITKLDELQLEFEVTDDFSADIKDLETWGNTYLSRIIFNMEWNAKKQLDKLHLQPQVPHTLKLPLYTPTSNTIRIPVQYLQPRVLWDAAYPDALKYATIGFILAREMIHGFDAIGRNYDNRGTHQIWWDLQSQEAYKERAECFAKKLGKLRLKNVADDHALVKTIADSAALSIAYRAFRPAFERQVDAQGYVEGLSLFPDYYDTQLFFIFYAQLWCTNYDRSIQNFKELPVSYRINGALANFRSFALEYQCEGYSKLNPKNRCEIF